MKNARIKSLVFSILLLCFTTTSFAQEGFKIGLSASPTFNWLKGDNADVTSQGMKMGVQYGLFIDYGFSENTAFSTGFMVAYNGGKLRYTDTTEFADYNFNLQFVEVPIAIKLSTNEVGNLRYYGQIGVVPGFRIRARTNVNFNDSASLENINIIQETATVPLNSKLINVSLQVGAGIEYALGGNALLVAGIFFNNGFMNLSKMRMKIKW